MGAGAGGTGCTYRLIKNGIKAVVVDKNPDFGGTAVFCGVDGWEPGVSLDGIHNEIQKKLFQMPSACHTTRMVPNMNLFDPSVGTDWSKHSFEKLPFGFCMPMGDSYGDTLGRCISIRGTDGPMKRFQFEGKCYTEAVHSIFEPFSENLTPMFGYNYVSCKKENGKLLSITVTTGEITVEIFADVFVDASGDIVLARDAGCDYTIGTEGFESYSEPSATQQSDTINAVSYVFRIGKTEDTQHIDTLPEWVKSIDLEKWKAEEMKQCLSFTVQYPNGDINVNMLPTMQGTEYFELGDKADKAGKARVYAYWHYLQTDKNMSGYTIKHIYDAGIRESYRLKGKYVLREQDLRQGILRQPKVGRTVAIADHAMDIHGKDGICKELIVPYEIPLECSMTKEYDNLFVACRGASFTHIAASSARLTRTMLSFGEGVGEYISELLTDTNDGEMML